MSLTAAPNSNEIDVQRTLATLIAAQVICLLAGRGHPVVAITAARRWAYRRRRAELSCRRRPRPAARRQGRRRQPTGREAGIIGGMLFIALSDAGTALASALAPWWWRCSASAPGVASPSGRAGGSVIGNVAPELRGRAIAANQAAPRPASPWRAARRPSYPTDREPASCGDGAALSRLASIRSARDGDRRPRWTTTASTGSCPERWKMARPHGGRGLFAGWLRGDQRPLVAAQVLPGGAAGAGALVSLAGLGGLVGAPVGGFGVDRGREGDGRGLGLIGAAR